MKKPDVFSQLLLLSSQYYDIGMEIKEKKDCGCKCDCQKNKEYKIKDEVRKFHCSGCFATISLNCWENSDYINNKTLRENVCRKCFKNHWINVMRRTLPLCIRDIE